MKLLSLIIVCCLSVNLFARDVEVIYGEDNRLDVYESTDELYLSLAESTAAMISWDDIERKNLFAYELSESDNHRKLCDDEPFSSQPQHGMCSGFLVAPDLLVTAGHCIESMSDCRNFAWVFNYKMEDADSFSSVLSLNDVYSCVEIVERSLQGDDDYALIRLDTSVAGREPLEYRTGGKVEDGANLVVIGHPTGMPTKIADGAWVRENNNRKYFMSNLDTYGGNSGSAVFNSDTGVVEGILVAGEQDYEYDYLSGCYNSYMCDDDGCRGETVTRITNIDAL